MRRYRYVTLAILAAAGFLLAACGEAGVDEDRFTALEERVAAVEAEAGNAGLIATMGIVDGAGLHEMDETINGEGRIDPGWEGSVNRARAAVAGTQWPESLRPTADLLLQSLDELLAALEANDVERAGPAATDAHGKAHDLSHDAWPLIAGEEHGGDGEEGSGGH